jgi:hypothetical protein
MVPSIGGVQYATTSMPVQTNAHPLPLIVVYLYGLRSYLVHIHSHSSICV